MTDDSEPMRVPEDQAGQQSEPQDVNLTLPAIRRPRLAERIAMARSAMPPVDSVEICEEIQPVVEIASPAPVPLTAVAVVEPVPTGLNEVQAVAPEILARYLLPPDEIEAPEPQMRADAPAPPATAFVAPDTDVPSLTLAELFAEMSESAADPVADDVAAPIADHTIGTEPEADAEAEADPIADAEPEPAPDDVPFGSERPVYTTLVFEEPPAPADPGLEPVSAATAELVSLMDAQRTLLAEMMRLRTEGPATAPVPEPLPMPMLPLTETGATDFDDEPPPMVLERAQAIHLAGGRALGRPLQEAPSRLPAFVGGVLMAAATAAAVYAWRVLG